MVQWIISKRWLLLIHIVNNVKLCNDNKLNVTCNTQTFKCWQKMTQGVQNNIDKCALTQGVQNNIDLWALTQGVQNNID